MLSNFEQVQEIKSTSFDFSKKSTYEELVQDTIRMGLIKKNILECDPKLVKKEIWEARKKHRDKVKERQALLDFFKGVKNGEIDPSVTAPPVKIPVLKNNEEPKGEVHFIDDVPVDYSSTDEFKLSEDPGTRALVSFIERPKIEIENKGRLSRAEVLNPLKKEVKVVGKKRGRPKTITAFLNPKAKTAEEEEEITEKLKNTSLEVWIAMVCRVYKSLESMISALDIDFKRIVFNSARLSERGMTTIKQLEHLAQIRAVKDQYMNLYVLNKMWANLLKTRDERLVFLVVLQRAVKTNKLTSQKLRTAYRIRRNIIKRFKEFCLVKGYDQEWFFEHFCEIPAIRYFAEHHDTEKRIEEIRLNGEV